MAFAHVQKKQPSVPKSVQKAVFAPMRAASADYWDGFTPSDIAPTPHTDGGIPPGQGNSDKRPYS